MDHYIPSTKSCSCGSTWLWLVLGLIGEEMDDKDETCGAVCSVKPRGDRIALWVRDKSDLESVNRIGKKLMALLELEAEPGILLEFTSHEAKPDEEKQEGLYSVSNPSQPMVRTPTVGTFAAAGLPDANGAKLASAAAAAAASSPSSMLMSPTSPNGKSFRGQPPRSPVFATHMASSPNADNAMPLEG